MKGFLRFKRFPGHQASKSRAQPRTGSSLPHIGPSSWLGLRKMNVQWFLAIRGPSALLLALIFYSSLGRWPTPPSPPMGLHGCLTWWEVLDCGTWHSWTSSAPSSVNQWIASSPRPWNAWSEASSRLVVSSTFHFLLSFSTVHFSTIGRQERFAHCSSEALSQCRPLGHHHIATEVAPCGSL